jgi:hypothetical protein
MIFLNSMLHALIGDDLTFSLRGFVIGSQIFNLILDLSFDCNSCISSVIEQCKVILGIYASKPFQWYHGYLIGCLFTFSTMALNIQDSYRNAIPKMGVHLELIRPNFLHSTSVMKVCIIPKHTFLASCCPCIPHLVMNPMLKLW